MLRFAYLPPARRRNEGVGRRSNRTGRSRAAEFREDYAITHRVAVRRRRRCIRVQSVINDRIWMRQTSYQRDTHR